MRPVRLEIQGFTCYREKQEIDFSHLGLFAISGPTGAGKSSILDAIAFALYGKIPRMGGQNLDEFISLGAARASVLFEFDLQETRFRVARSMPRSGPKKVQLEQISNSSQKALADGVGEVNAKLQALLGLEYEAFIQSVLLPQGQFAKFLQSRPNEQRQILRELLRLGIYERMRERAYAEAKEIAVKMQSDRNLLEGPYANAIPLNVTLLETELESLRERRETATTERDNLRQSLEFLLAQWQLIKERQVRQEFLQELQLDRPKIDKLKQKVERAKTAALVLPVLEQATAKLRAWQAINDAVNELERALGAATKEIMRRKQSFLQAQSRAGALPLKRSRAMALAAIQPILKERTALAMRRARAQEALAKAESATREGETLLKNADIGVAQSKAQLERLRKERSDLGYDADNHAIFKKSERLAYSLAQAREHLALLKPENVQAAVQEAEAALQEAQREFDSAQIEQANAEEEARSAQTRLEGAQDRDKAQALRSTLTLGCTCPVCEQPVASIPSIESSTNLQEAKNAATSAKKRSAACAEKAAFARDNFSRSHINAENERKKAHDWEEQAARYRKELDDLTRSLVTAIKPFDCPVEVSIDVFVQHELARFERLNLLHQEKGEEINRAEIKAHKAESARNDVMHKLDTAKEERLRLTGEIADADQRLAEYDAKVGDVDSSDPEEELAALKEEIEAIEKAFRDSEEHYREAETHARQTELAVTEAKGRLVSAVSERDASQLTAEKALHDAGFKDGYEVSQASIDPGAIAKYENQLKTFERDLSQTQTRIEELDTELSGVTLTEADVNRESEKAKKAETAVNALERRIGEQTEKLQRLKDDTERAEALRIDYEMRRSRYVLVQQLSQDLKGDCFQQYLLDASFHGLVEGASIRLRELNDRYELAFIEGKFAVIDHDHGSLSRLADTLSGGETFLVSLALALELSEQVQQAAGAVRLDSLFIDEGFGSLDPETLETVADAIESLSKANRMIGVITHVAELHRRLPRLEVRPSASGSVVEFVEE